MGAHAGLRRHRQGPFDDAADQPRPRRVRGDVGGLPRSAGQHEHAAERRGRPGRRRRPAHRRGARRRAHQVGTAQLAQRPRLARRAVRRRERDHGGRLQCDGRPLRRARHRWRRSGALFGCRSRGRFRGARHLADRRAAVARQPDRPRARDARAGASRGSASSTTSTARAATIVRSSRRSAAADDSCAASSGGARMDDMANSSDTSTTETAAEAVSDEEAGRNANRSTTPSSEGFKDFIGNGWADRDETLPSAREQSSFAAARRAKVSAAFPGQRLIVPAGDMKQRANDTDYPFRAHSAFAHLTGWGSDSEPGRRARLRAHRRRPRGHRLLPRARRTRLRGVLREPRDRRVLDRGAPVARARRGRPRRGDARPRRVRPRRRCRRHRDPRAARGRCIRHRARRPRAHPLRRRAGAVDERGRRAVLDRGRRRRTSPTASSPGSSPSCDS